ARAARAPPPPRRTGPVGPASSTRSRPGSPAPCRRGQPPARSAGPATFFSRVLGVGADQPVLGPLPADAEPLEHQPDGLAAERALGPALLEADQGGQFERPEAGSLAEVARGLVQQGAEVFIALFGPGGVGGLGGLGLRAQAGRPLGGEGPQGVADGLRGAAQGGGDPGGPLAPVAGEEDLAAAQGEGVARAQPLAQRGPFGDRKSADEQWWFHASFYAPDAVTNPVLWKCTRRRAGRRRRCCGSRSPACLAGPRR